LQVREQSFVLKNRPQHGHEAVEDAAQFLSLRRQIDVDGEEWTVETPTEELGASHFYDQSKNTLERELFIGRLRQVLVARRAGERTQDILISFFSHSITLPLSHLI
jgi:hypothetical protein